MKVAVGASSFADGNDRIERLFAEKGVELVRNPFGRRLTKEEIIRHLQGADGLLAGLEPLDDEVFGACPGLKAIARIGIGMDNVDAEAAGRRGIKVSNTPEGPTDAVAEMTLAALLAICHNIIPSDRNVHDGVWKKRLGKSVSELTVLIIGYGHIGRRTSALLGELGAKILVYDKYNESASNVTFEEGLSAADVISLHASGRDEIIGTQEFGMMKDGVIMLNSARGGLINEKALYDALKSGKVSAFWGDALWQEPYGGMLKECDNAILTPHICTYTTKCRSNMEMQAVENLFRDLGV